MLESIVQQETINGKPFQNPLAESASIRPDGHDRAGTPPCDQVRLIACLGWSSQNGSAVRNQHKRCSALSAIATAENANAQAPSELPFHDQDHNGRLPGPTDREVAHTHDTTGKAPLRQPAALV